MVVGMDGLAEVDGDNNGVGELSSARTTMAGVPQVFERYACISTHEFPLSNVRCSNEFGLRQRRVVNQVPFDVPRDSRLINGRSDLILL